MSCAHRAEVLARATCAPRVRLRFARTTFHACTCPRSARLRVRALQSPKCCALGVPVQFVVHLSRLAQTVLADIVYTLSPVPARAVMRVLAPLVPA